MKNLDLLVNLRSTPAHLQYSSDADLRWNQEVLQGLEKLGGNKAEFLTQDLWKRLGEDGKVRLSKNQIYLTKFD